MRKRFSVAGLLFSAVVTTIFLYILIPVVVVVIASFNPDQIIRFPPKGFSWHWWGAVFSEKWVRLGVFSIKVAVYAALASTLLGLGAAMVIARCQFRWRNFLQTAILSPVMLPMIVTGVSIFQFLHAIGLKTLLGFGALVVGHTVVTLPYSTRTILISFRGLRREVELAAMDLGAGPFQTFWHVTLPLIKNGVFAGLVFAFINSFNNIPISLFLARPGQSTVPIEMLATMEYGFDPSLAAVATFTMLLVLGVIAIAERVAGISKFMYE